MGDPRQHSSSGPEQRRLDLLPTHHPAFRTHARRPAAQAPGTWGLPGTARAPAPGRTRAASSSDVAAFPPRLPVQSWSTLRASRTCGGCRATANIFPGRSRLKCREATTQDWPGGAQEPDGGQSTLRGPNSETQARSYLLETRQGTLMRPEQHTGSVQGRGTCPPRGAPGHRPGLPGWLHFGFEGLHAVPVPTLGGPTSHRSDGPPLDVVQVSTCAHVAPELPLQTAHAPGCSLPAGRLGRLSHRALVEDGPSVQACGLGAGRAGPLGWRSHGGQCPRSAGDTPPRPSTSAFWGAQTSLGG